MGEKIKVGGSMRILLDVPGAVAERGKNPVVDEIRDICKEFGDVQSVVDRERSGSNERVLITDIDWFAATWQARGGTAIHVNMNNDAPIKVLDGLIKILRERAPKPTSKSA